MGLFGIKKKSVKPLEQTDIGDVSINSGTGVIKAYIPGWLYKPPFGYPRKEDLPLIRQLARNPYIYSVIKTLADEAASTKYDIVYKEEAEPNDAVDKIREDIIKFLDNPNKNKESFQHVLRAAVKDICEVDSGVIVKVFDKMGRFCSIFARDGASFLKNTDPFGYIGNRAEYIEPTHSISTQSAPGLPDWQATMHSYSLAYKDVAAYFQYGMTGLALPVPFGRREIIYLMMNPRSDSPYGLSPIQILADIITTLVYGSNYNLDFYMNNNMPEGIIQLINANQDSIKAFRERFDAQFREQDKSTGFWRKIGFKFPIVNQEAKFTPFQLDPKVMQIIEQQSWFTKIVWACFGVTADEMGFTEDSNKAVSQSQQQVYKRKAVRPLLALIKYHMDKEIISEWGQEAFDLLEFKWDDYDLDEDIKKHTLYEAQIRMGIKTAEMVAEEEGIDMERLKESKEEEQEKEMEMFEQQASFGNDDDGGGGKKPFRKKDEPSSGNDSNKGKSFNIGLKHKYIKRTGGPGKYIYWYRDPKTGKISGRKREKKVKLSRADKILELIAGAKSKIKPADKKAYKEAIDAYNNKKDTFHLHKNSKGNWKPDRIKKVHKPILKKYKDASEHTKAEGTPNVLFLSGLPGSGKTYSTQQNYKEVPGTNKLVKEDKKGNRYLVLNADDVKNWIPENNKGVSAGRTHNESSIITKQLVKKYMSERHNIIIDGTMAKMGKAKRQVEGFKGRGYETSLIHVSTSIDISLKFAEERYHKEGRLIAYDLMPSYEKKINESIKSLKSKFDNFKEINTTRHLETLGGLK